MPAFCLLNSMLWKLWNFVRVHLLGEICSDPSTGRWHMIQSEMDTCTWWPRQLSQPLIWACFRAALHTSMTSKSYWPWSLIRAGSQIHLLLLKTCLESTCYYITSPKSKPQNDPLLDINTCILCWLICFRKKVGGRKTNRVSKQGYKVYLSTKATPVHPPGSNTMCGHSHNQHNVVHFLGWIFWSTLLKLKWSLNHVLIPRLW